jgi:hypothetical protein
LAGKGEEKRRMALEVYFETRQEKSEYPRSIATAAAFDFLEKTGIQCHRGLVEEKTPKVFISCLNLTDYDRNKLGNRWA